MSNNIYGITLKVWDEMTTPLAKMRDSMGGMTARIKANQSAIQGLKKNMASFSQFDKLKTAADKSAKALDKQQQRVAELNAKIKASKKPTDAMLNRYKTAEKRLQELNSKHKEHRRNMGQHLKQMKEAGIDTKNLSSERERLARTMGKLNDKLRVQHGLLATQRKAWNLSRKAAESAFQIGRRIATSSLLAGAGGLGLGLNFNKQQINQVRELTAWSEAFNVSTQELQAWTMAAKPVGVRAEKIADIFKDVSDKVGDFTLTGGGEAKELFETLKLDPKKFKDMTPDKMFLEVGAALEKSDLSKSEKIFLLEALANDASLLLPLLENNAAAIKQARDNAEDYGVTLSDAEKERLKLSGKGWAELGNRIDGIKTRAGLVLNDLLIDTEAFSWINKILENALFDIQWLVATGELKEWFNDVTSAIRDTTSWIKKTSGNIFDMANEVAEFVGGWDKLLIGLAAFKAVGIAASIAALANPLGIAIASVGLLTAGFLALRDAAEQAKKAQAFADEVRNTPGVQRHYAKFEAQQDPRLWRMMNQKAKDAKFHKWVKKEARSGKYDRPALNSPNQTLPKLQAQQQTVKTSGNIHVKIDSDKPVTVKKVESQGMDLSLDTGMAGFAP